MDDTYIQIDHWFYTSDWQERHAQAISDLEEGRFTEYSSGDEFYDALLKAVENDDDTR